MAEEESPSRDFRWVEPAAQGGARRRRWWWVLAAGFVVVVLVGAGVWAASGTSNRAGKSGPDGAEPERTWVPPIGTPKEILVSFGLDRQPVAGWQVSATDVGLPDYAPVGDLFASGGDKAYFLSQFVDDLCESACRPPQAWVYGIDTRTGARLFNPLPLPNYKYDASCYGNGPGVAVCLRSMEPLTAWVIDLGRGAVTFTGPTDVYYSSHLGKPAAHATGTWLGQTRLLAAVDGQGLFGMGSRGERTWSVPGSGFFDPTANRVADDIPAPPLAVSASGLVEVTDRVFSVADGHDMTPAAPAGTTLGRAVVYNEGFAYAYRKPQTRETGVVFYDVKGRLVAQRPTGQSRVRLLDNPAMPTVEVDGNWQVFTAAGKPVTQIPAQEIAPHLRTIGTKLYVSRGNVSENRWQQWDLLTGQPGATCAGMNLEKTFPNGDYVGSDGTTIVGQLDAATRQFGAMDMTTCQIAWKTPEGVRVYIWKVGTGLLQEDLTHNTLVWLRPPA